MKDVIKELIKEVISEKAGGLNSQVTKSGRMFYSVRSTFKKELKSDEFEEYAIAENNEEKDSDGLMDLTPDEMERLLIDFGAMGENKYKSGSNTKVKYEISQNSARIGALMDEGVIETVLLYGDGDPKIVQPILDKKYNSRINVQLLLDGGNILELIGNVPQNKMAKGIKQDAIIHENMKRLLNNCNKYKIKYVYLYDIPTRTWLDVIDVNKGVNEEKTREIVSDLIKEVIGELKQ